MTQPLSIKCLSNFTINIDKIATTDGYTGLRLQFWFTKLFSKLDSTTTERDELKSADYSMFEQEDYTDILIP